MKFCQMKDAVIDSTVIQTHDLLLLKFGCDNMAKHSIVIRKNTLGDKAKSIYRLCDKHFNRLMEAEEAKEDRQPLSKVIQRMNDYKGVKSVEIYGTYQPKFRFRKNRL